MSVTRSCSCCALRFERRHLLQDFRKTRLFTLRRLDVETELCFLLVQRPVAPSHEQDAVRTSTTLPAIVTFWPICSDEPAGLDRAALAGDEVDANHRSPAFRSARPSATAASGAIFGSRYPELVAVERHLTERIEGLDRRLEALAQRVGRSRRRATRRRSARCDRCDRLAAVPLKKSNVFSISSSTLSVTARSTGRASSKRHVLGVGALLQLLGDVVRKVELLLHGFGERVAAHRDVAGEHRLRAGRGC